MRSIRGAGDEKKTPRVRRGFPGVISFDMSEPGEAANPLGGRKVAR
jgi:hypothetical protein